MTLTRSLIATLTLLFSFTGCLVQPGEEGADPTLVGSTDESVASTQNGLTNTAFVPADDSFNFGNSFVNQTGLADVTTGGLCGGMSYSALDFFNAKRKIPGQDYAPAEGTVLRNYLLARQKKSLESNLDHWAELGVNPFGWRTSEFWNWGIQKTGRVAELRAAIDAGRPVPLGLSGINQVTKAGCADCKGDHQVLAIGYDLGAYSAEGGGGYPNLKIYVSDPNYPNEKLTLRPDKANLRYYYHERPSVKWLTYFVDVNYRPVVPPTIPVVTTGMLVTFYTGGDDLRGGTDNVNVVFTLKNGSTLRFNKVNLGQRWMNNTSSSVPLAFPAGVAPADAAAITIETTFGGGIGGDNWNLDRLHVQNILNVVKWSTRFNSSGAPLMRFTGDAKSKKYALN